MTHSDGTQRTERQTDGASCRKSCSRPLSTPKGHRSFQEGGASMTAEMFQRIVRVLGFAIP